MDRREFMKAAVAMAGSVGLTQVVKAGTQAQKLWTSRLIAKEDPSDIDQLNHALGAEHQAIFAYDSALHTGLLRGEGKEFAKIFQESHQGHAEILSNAVRSLGAEPVKPKKTYDFGVRFSTPVQVVKFAYNLERGAAQAYLNAVDDLQNNKLKYAAAQIMADEVVHATTWYRLLGSHPFAGGFNQLPSKT